MSKGLIKTVTLLVLIFSLGARAQSIEYPSKPIRLVVAFAAGGIADMMARLVGAKLSAKLGQPVLIDNKAGAGGNIGAKVVAQAEPDGYTFLVTTAAFAVNPSLYKSPGYNISEFMPVALTASTPNIFAVSSGNPANSLQELAKNFKGRPLTYSTAGIGSSSHLTAQYIFVNVMGLDATHIPYQGGAPAINAAVAGHVDVVSVSMPAVMSNILGGKLKGMGLASLKRVDALANTATIAESGYGDYEDRSWIGFFAPAKTPPEVIRKINAEINDIISQADTKEKLISVGFEPYTGTPVEFSQYLKLETAKWAQIVKSTKITLND